MKFTNDPDRSTQLARLLYPSVALFLVAVVVIFFSDIPTAEKWSYFAFVVIIEFLLLLLVAGAKKRLRGHGPN